MTDADRNTGLTQRIDELAVEVGEEADENGRTRLTLQRDGRYVLEHAGGHETERREPIVADARELLDEPIEEVFSRAEAIEWRRPFPPRPGIPDEAIVDWRIRTSEGEVTAKMWLRDVEKEKEVAALFAVLRSVVDKASGGELFL